MPVTSFRILQGTGPGGQPGAAVTPRPTPGADADEALVLALRRGEARAELEAWSRFAPRVEGTLRRMLGPDGDHEDLLQEVFVRFFRRIGTLRAPAAVRGFLTGICLRVVRGEIASRRRRRWLHLTPTGEPPEVAARVRDDESREAVRRYYRLLEGLGRRDRSIFVARTIEGLTLEEVAALHDVSVSTAQRRIEHATKRMSLLARRDPLLAAFADGGVG